MSRSVIAGALAAGVLTLGGTAGATEPAETGAGAAVDPLVEGGRTPVAQPGTRAARRGSLSRSQLRNRLARQLRRVGGGSGAWVYDLRAGGGGRLLFSSSGKRRRLIASNTKLFTTAVFLDRFGADGRLETGVWERGRRGGRNDQIVRGSLALVGAGDPALATRRFARRHGLPLTNLAPLARRVRAAGIKRVKRNLRVDPTIFDGRRSVPQPGITGGPWLSTLSGLSFNSGFDGGRYARNPERTAGRRFIALLKKAGVKVRGRVKVGSVPGKVTRRPELGVAESPPAARLAARTNTASDNFFAEMLLKRASARRKRRGTTARGASKAERFARSVGSGASLVNGSGLSRTNVASPKEVGRLLIHMAGDGDLAKPFRDSLAVAGRTGTLAARMRGTAAEGRCQGKTGTLNGVSALSGYCRSGAGRIAFSILMNGVNLDAARRAQDAMAAAIARYG